MPIYEYRCADCKKRSSIFVRGFEDPPGLTCPACGGHDLTRLFSRFRVGKGESYYRKGIYEDIFSDSNLIKGLESNDPRAMAEWSRRMSHGAGEDITPESEEVLGKLDAGEPIGKVMEDAKEVLSDYAIGGDDDSGGGHSSED